jgi:hypothetical protein
MGQMSAAVERDEYRDEVHGGKYPPQLHVGLSDGGGSGMDDVLKRLGVVESSVSEIRTQVGGITATLPHLATKADVNQVRVEVTEVKAAVAAIAEVIPHLATRADLSREISSVRAEIGSVKADLSREISSVRAEIGSVKADLTEKIGLLESHLVRWIVGIIIAAAGLAFTIGRYGH